MLPEASFLGDIFHELFRFSSENLKNKCDWGKKRKKKWENFYKKKNKEGSEMVVGPPEVKLHGNPSEFAVFAHARQAVLEAWAHKASQIYLNSSSSITVLESTYEGDSDSDVTEIYHPQVPRVPKIVGIGLRCVLELIRDSRQSHPVLCTRALTALLDVLQGQQPQGLQSEPAEVIDPLFDLLLDLATCYGPESAVPDDGNHLTAIACSCLLSLVIVRGSTGKLLSAAAALLMCPKQLANQNIHLPLVMTALQSSIYAVLLGKISRPDWLTHGVPSSSKIDSFPIKNSGLGTVRSLASDGQYLYLYSSRGLFKIGSGHGGTIKGHIYYCVPDFFHDDRGWLGFANGWLWLKVSGKKGCELLRIDRDPFKVVDTLRLDTRDWSPGVWFSDADQLGIITSISDDGFIVKTLNPNVKPATITSELSLKLARKCIDIMGCSSFDEDSGNKALNTDFEDEISSIVAGKEFGLVRTSSGKVFYSGKASSIGMKSGGSSGRWSELVIPKGARAQHVSVGHEGLHAVIVTEDGGVFFCGTARRGEDGDLNKARRQPKAVKPKKIVKVEDEFIVHAAANNGTTALVTRNGQLLMFGKDTVHCNSSTGQVLGMENLQITQVALGKAHAVALTSKGIVYTFGINNKGQCGRDFVTQVKEAVAMETVAQEEEKEDEFDWDDAQDLICPPGKHQWRHDLCMVCTVCKECTGYSISCLSSVRPHRNPGQECGCGEGDSGCSVCGCCRVCAKEYVDNSDLAVLGPSEAGDPSGLMRLDIIFSGDSQGIRHTNKLQEHLQRRLEERKQRQNRKASSKHYCGLKIKSSNSRSCSSSVRSGTSVPIFRAPAPVKFSNLINEEQAGGSDIERDTSRVTSLSPAPIALPYTCPVIQIACGLHHSVVLTQSGEVFTFGSNIYGQLGIGDVLLRGGPVSVRLPCPAQSVAAGSNHTIILTVKGEVFTFGSHQKGQLGRKSSKSSNEPSTSAFGRKGSYSRHEAPWYAIPGPVPGIGPNSGRRATWIGAAGDQTFIKVDESLINSLSLEQATITGNKTCILLVPRGENYSFQSLAISRRDGNCSVFSGAGQAHLIGSPVCLDPLYNVLWSYQHSTNLIFCYNIIASEAKGLEALSHSMFDPDLVLPITPGCLIKRSQAALHLLGALDTLAQAQHHKLEVGSEILEKQVGPTKAYTLQDFCAVNRFESHGGGWGYSGHSIEAIRFMADSDIILGGFGLFGGRGEYTAKIKLLDIGVDGGEQESDGEVIAETEDIPYECGPRQKYPMLFEEPILLQSNRWYIAWARISGPSSDCGSNGQAMIVTEDQISFYFKSSKKSNNGTDVNAGQIPQLLYKIITQETKAPPRQIDLLEPVFVLSKEFSSTVSRECFQSLLALLHWGWNALKSGYLDLNGSISTVSTHAEHERLTRLVYINRASLRLIHLFTNEIYPDQIFSKKAVSESVRLAESVGDVRALLRQILSDKPITGAHKELTDAVLEECHKTFVFIFHALYPTPFLKWTCLCDLLAKTDKTGYHYTQHDRLLSAVLEALCCPTVRLRTALPILTDSLDPSMRQLSPSDNSGFAVSGADHHYPLLVEQMSYRTQLEKNGEAIANWSWKEVLDKLLDLAILPAKRDLMQKPSKLSKTLVKNCCNLLARVLAELALQSCGSDEDIQGSCGRVLHATPSRFMRTNQTRTWNTGNGSPDAICFSVDKPGVVIAGACVYGGVGVLEYELELLDDQSSSGSGDPSPAQRWTTLEVVKGTFGPDDCVSDVAELKFSKPVPIKDKVKYAIRLRNQGGRTSNGDGGLNSVKGPDGVTFSFSTCSLSFNGTTQTRGQIPQILYYSNPQDGTLQHTAKAVAEHQARKSTLSMTTAIFNRCSGLLSVAREKAEDLNVNKILGNACAITTLLPLVLAHVGSLGTSDPRSAVQIINLIQDLLPHVSALNLLDLSNNSYELPKMTTSNHYAWVESDHPYKAASVSNYRVLFPESVKWMVIEFSPRCGTAQIEDSLKLYVPSISKVWERHCEDDKTDLTTSSYWKVFRTLRGGTTWPQDAIVLPGNEVIFSLETASDYLKNEKACNYGFRCLVVGYEWNSLPNNGLKHLESELSFTAGMCAASLIKKDLQLPPITVEEAEEDAELAEEAAMLVANEHSSLLMRGLVLSQTPTIFQALDGILPFSCHSNERLFLRDFIQCSPSTSGGRLARWLQPDPYADPTKCEVVYNRDEMRCGWPTVVTILIKDQYCELVHVPNLKIEVKAVPIDKKDGDFDTGRKIRKVGDVESTSVQPSLDIPYEVTVDDKICYHSITMMKAYENFSFEELRYFYPSVRRTCENMLVRPYNDGTFCATWTPSNTGWYSILVIIDGYPLEGIYKAEVKEPPQGVAPPAQSVVKKTAYQPSKIRKFVANYSAGLRIRAHPSLQSEQIGVVQVNGTIAFIDEIHNDDGVWLRLNHESIKQYCPGSVSGISEAWCLQYNQHLGKTLLLPVEEPKRILDQVMKEAIGKKMQDTIQRDKSFKGTVPGIYTVVKCGAACHNVRSKPSLQAAPVGMMVLGNQVEVLDQVVNSEGTWVKISPEVASKYCFNHVTEAWSLAQSPNNELYLRQETNPEMEAKILDASSTTSSPKKGYDFTANTSGGFGTGEVSTFSFTPPKTTPPQSFHTSSDPFVFGYGLDFKMGIDKKNIQKLDGKSIKERDTCSELIGVSVKDLVKAIGESRVNGNGETPPGTPPQRSSSPKTVGLPQGRTSSPRTQIFSSTSSSPNIQIPPISPFGDTEKTSQCSSPLPVPGSRKRSPRTSTSGPGPSTPISQGYSPLVSGGALIDSQYSMASQRRGSTQSDTSALVSSLTRDLSQSPLTKDLSPSPSSSFHIRSEGSPIKKDCLNDDLISGRKNVITESQESPKKDSSFNFTESTKAVMQAGTQTSPEGVALVKGHFSIGSASVKEERISPKFIRKDRNIARNTRKAMSPAPQVSSSGDRCFNMVKEAMSPSVAESLRAIFSAFLWQEGIVHDAMACASFLKFHPTLPKQGALVVTRKLASPVNTAKEELTKEQRQFQRHSVEVSTSGTYLHIQPATLESLTRSAANANANRTRRKQSPQEASIKEEVPAEIVKPKHAYQSDNVNKIKSDAVKNDNGVVTVSVLPPALKGLVIIWEELSSIFLRAFEQQTLPPSPLLPSKFSRNAALNREKSATKKHNDFFKSKSEGKRSSRKKKDWKPLGKLNVLGEACELIAPLLTAGNERETFCELCGGIYPHPVTYHMRQSHPGCGGITGGKGYNSSGNYSVGWAGHCGDGAVGGNSWYLLCDSCREKYLRIKKEGLSVNKDKKKTSVRKKPAIIPPVLSNLLPLTSPVFGQNNSQESHLIMRDNAMFLLDLASSSNSVMSNQQQRTGVGFTASIISSITENHSPPDPPGPFSPVGSFQCLPFLGNHLKEQELQEVLQRQMPHELDASCNGNFQPNSLFDESDSDIHKGRLFHRSVSMGTSGIPWAKKDGDGRVMLLRKRNNSSSGEVMSEGGSSLLCRPSATLQKLIPGLDESAIISKEDRVTLDLLRRPSVSFILRRHPILALRFAMKHSLRKATCRLYAFQALNWLLRNVTQPVCLHDLLWWFVASLSQPATSLEAEALDDQIKKEDGDLFKACDHPLSDITFAGDAAIPLWKAFHQFLKTVADLMFLLPPSCALQTMAVRCWSLKFSQVDHGFLHRCQVFNNISKILSRSEEESDDASVSLHESGMSQQPNTLVEILKDLTSEVEIKVSSRQAMVGSLTDNSTETFWESGDEDRNKTKTITLMCPPNSGPKVIYLHIDNCRDLANKVASVTFLSGSSGEELHKIRQVDVESRSTGWLSTSIPDGRNEIIKLELKGPDNSLRIRQVRVLGESSENLAIPQRSATTVQQKLCELETLKVFRLITAQVFGKLIAGEDEEPAEPEDDRVEDNNDLKEHMVGILFSRSKLTHLQKQVCMHIVHALRKETLRVREEWECLLCSPVPSETKPSDTYAFEMLSMVLALSGSSVGRVYLSHQYGLLTDLLSLLHTGSARVQRQVTALLRRVLPEVSPATLANVLGVDKLPPSDFSIISTGAKQQPFDFYQMGILDVFLSVVAKSLTVQVKVKGREVKGVTTVTLATAIHPRDPMGQRWWLRGCISRKLAEDIIQLLNDMSAGKLSDAWANITKGAIAENIINLTRLDESQRGPSECLKTPTLWLALASLCVLDKDHVERLSSGQWSRTDGQPPPPKPTCTNHDDNITGAIIQCSVCGNLCADCDRYLHLHRRTRMHQRQVCKEEEEAIKVDLHEGCGRTKLFWVLALADSCTLKAMVEFREGSKSKSTGTGVCRFCGATGNSGLLAIGNVCADQECQEHAKNICNKIHPCGHVCGGLAGEVVCLPCLQNCKSSPNLKQDADDMCMICFTEALSCAPSIQLHCGHVFHAHCARNALIRRWAGPRITFSFSQCPICKSPMKHSVLSELLKPIQELYEDVKRKALMRLEYEGLHRAVAITTPSAKFFNDPASYAMDRYAYYVCYKCNKAYYGGEARCDADMNGDFDPSELVCGGCSDVARAQMCPKHGTDFLEYKCRYCCSVAVFFCFGTTHFCNSCHDDFQRVTNISKSELPNCPAGPKAKQLDGEECPLHVCHPPTGEEFALGCGVCRNAHTF